MGRVSPRTTSRSPRERSATRSSRCLTTERTSSSLSSPPWARSTPLPSRRPPPVASKRRNAFTCVLLSFPGFPLDSFLFSAFLDWLAAVDVPSCAARKQPSFLRHGPLPSQHRRTSHLCSSCACQCLLLHSPRDERLSTLAPPFSPPHRPRTSSKTWASTAPGRRCHPPLPFFRRSSILHGVIFISFPPSRTIDS